MPDKSYVAVIRVPTTDPYAYIELHHKGTLKDLMEAYNEATAMVKVGVGLETKEWNRVLDAYRAGKGMHPEEMEKMNKAQLWMIHELDKSNSRTKK